MNAAESDHNSFLSTVLHPTPAFNVYYPAYVAENVHNTCETYTLILEINTVM